MSSYNDFALRSAFSSKENILQVCLVLTAAILFYKLIKQLLFEKLPPGPIGLPVVGYLPFLGKKPHETFHQLSKKYGSIFSVRLGSKCTIVLNDYEVMKEVLCLTSALDRDTAAFDFILEGGFANKNGTEWEEQRRFTIQAMRDLGIGRGSWEKRIQEDISEFLKKLSCFNGKPTVIDDLLAHTVGGNMLSLLIGRKLEKGKDDEYIQMTRDFSDAVIVNSIATNILSLIPGLRTLLRGLKAGASYKTLKVMEKFSSSTQNEIQKHKTDEEFSHATDFINIYLEKMNSMKNSRSKHYFSEGNAEGNIVNLFIGGSDTIIASLGWLFRLMAAHQDIQKKVQDELDDVIGTDGTISYEDRAKIPYTFAVLLEGQRFCSVVPLSPPRRAHEDFEVRGYVIPKGATILANIAAIHHDSKYWDHPEEFKPERFLSADGSKAITNLPSFVTFSIGRRNCPGETVAWMEIMTFFTSIMQKFTIRLPDGVKPNYEYKTGIVNHLVPQEICFLTRT